MLLKQVQFEGYNLKYELAKRSSNYVTTSRLPFYCYRIRRRFSLPLPVTYLPELDVQVRGFEQAYPWQIWCLWALEERVYALGGAADCLVDKVARERCIEDLKGLAQWPRYTVEDKLDLPYAHAVQLMAIAFREWAWLPEGLSDTLRDSLQRAVEEGLPLVPAAVSDLDSYQMLLAKPNPHQHLHNIPLIAQAALATAAEVIDHPERATLSDRFSQLYQARQALCHEGLTEGISYDGYLANFALAWVGTQPAEVRETIVHHPAMLDLEAQARGLACPGAVADSAEIGDLEPVEMPFIWSALARLQHWAFSSAREALLVAVPVNRLRSDALWLLCQPEKCDPSFESTTLLPAVQQSAAAVTLATGLENDDLSVVASLCRSPMNHIQADSGTLLIGSAGRWWVTDPGYQQYLKTSEREFTLGAIAHNTPVVNGFAQTQKAARLLHSGILSNKAQDTAFAAMELTACYPIAAQVEIVTRTVWRVGKQHVIVCDTVVSRTAAPVAYNWHGNAEAFWGEHEGAVSLYEDESHRSLWIQSSQQPLCLTQQHRLRGSRGSCTLQVQQSGVHHWWVFSFGDSPPAFHAHDTLAVVDGIALDLTETICASSEVALEVVIHNDHIQPLVQEGCEPIGDLPGSGWSFELEVNGESVMRLITERRHVCFPVPKFKAEDSVAIRAKPNAEGADQDSTVHRFLTESDKSKILAIPLRVYAEIQEGQVNAHCELMPGNMEGELEYAFYLLVEGEKTQVCWYKASESHCFTLTPEEVGRPVQIRGFVREKASPQKKLSATSISLVF